MALSPNRIRPIHLLIVLGTRPEAIKLSPLVLAAQAHPVFTVDVISTGQHQEMLAPMLDLFGVTPTRSLNIMRPAQTLTDVTVGVLTGVGEAIDALHPDWVIVQGDTTTTFAGALAAFYRHVPVAHVEAGLRTGHRYSPFPEEINRVLTTGLATLHLAPTEGSRANLLAEGINPTAIEVTGNTGIDALLLMRARLAAGQGMDQGTNQGRDQGRTGGETNSQAPSYPEGPRLLVTAHRRENQGEAMAGICAAILTLLERYPELSVEFPVHLSPRVRETVLPALSGHPRIELCEPLGYAEFIAAMDRATLILTDSGGVQEEAPSLGKPVLVLRESTERPEAAQAGTAIIVGTDPDRIVAEAARLLADPHAYRLMAAIGNPYGDGQACARILDAIARRHGAAAATEEIAHDNDAAGVPG